MRRIAGRTWACLSGLIVFGVLLLIYSGTLQRDVNGSDHGYVLDVGEIQVALNLWGTIHYTGYPLFTMASALLTSGFRAVGFSPAAAASSAATVWSLLGLAGAYWLIVRVTEGEHVLAALAVLALGLVETFWMHSVVAEVYSFSLFLVSATLLAAIGLSSPTVGDEREREWRWWLAVALLGMSVEHHRILISLVPLVFLLAFPTLRERNRNWLAFGAKSALLFALPFLAYLYLPLRALQGARWVYGQPGTWDGFWTQFSGREMTPYVLEWPRNLAAWSANFYFLVNQLQRQLPVVLLLAGAVGLVWLAWSRSLWIGLALLLGTLEFLAFIVVFPSAVWAPAVLMPSILFLVIGLAYLAHRLAQVVTNIRTLPLSPLVEGMIGGGGLLLALWLFRANLPFVCRLVNDPLGREVIQILQPLGGADLPGGRDVVALPWGGVYSAAAYGLYVTGELDGFELVDHRVDLRSIVQREGKVLTPAFNLGNWPLYWWVELLGEAHFSSAAPGVAMISQAALYEDIPEQIGFDLGNSVRVQTADLFWEGENELRLTIYWKATQPVDSDYQVAVHLVARDPPESAQDVLAQADSLNPVGGWYPTSFWVTGEVVRDDYTLTVPTDAFPVAVRIAMYQVEESGGFVNTEWLSFSIPERPG